jgi:hypothetical protein
VFAVANNQFVVPIPGWYLLHSHFCATVPNNGWLNTSAWKNGVLHSDGGGESISSQTLAHAVMSASIHCLNSGDTVSVNFNSSAALAVLTGIAECYASLHFLGSG